MTEKKNTANSVWKIVTAIAIIISLCTIVWAYRINTEWHTKYNRVNDENVNLKSTINILDVKLEYCEKSLDSYLTKEKSSDLTIEEGLKKDMEELENLLEEMHMSEEELESFREILENIRLKDKDD